MKRRILVVTEATYATINRALGYVIMNAEYAEFDGDHDEAAARSFQRAKDAIKDAPVRDIDQDARAIVEMVDMASDNSCSCVDLERGHARDCFVMSSRHEVDRAMKIAKLLQQGGSWSGMCPAGKHGLDHRGQTCDLCSLEKEVECQTCLGYGYFNEHGKPCQSANSVRKCLDCRGTGKVLT